MIFHCIIFVLNCLAFLAFFLAELFLQHFLTSHQVQVLVSQFFQRFYCLSVLLLLQLFFWITFLEAVFAASHPVFVAVSIIVDRFILNEKNPYRLQGSKNLIFVCTDFRACKLVWSTSSYTQIQ